MYNSFYMINSGLVQVVRVSFLHFRTELPNFQHISPQKLAVIGGLDK